MRAQSIPNQFPDYPIIRLPNSAEACLTSLAARVTFRRMKSPWTAALVGAAMSVSLPAAPQDKPQLPKSQMPDLGRPTRPNDEQPLFNFDDYFLGKWTFEWDVPEGILGPSGTIKGFVTYKRIDGPFFQGETTANGPGGAFTVKETIAYRKEGKTVARWLTD